MAPFAAVWMAAALALLPPATLPLGAAVAVSGGQRVADPRLGIHVTDGVADAPPAGVFGVERLWDTGAIWCRMNPQPGLWDFTPLTSQLDAAAGRGASQVIVVLGFPPAHAVNGKPNPGEAPWLCADHGHASLLPSDEVWQDYVRRTAEAVAAWRTVHPLTVVHFQVWNEPALAWFLERGQSASRLVELAAQARAVVQSMVPGALVISASMVPNSSPHRARWQREFVVAASDWVDVHGGFLFDVWAVHVYPVGTTFDEVWTGPQGYVPRMDDVLATIAPARRSGDQVWITEINANIAFEAPPSQVLSDTDQAMFVQAVAQDTLQRGIPVVVWYRWNYDPWGLGNGQIVFSGSSAAMGALR